MRAKRGGFVFGFRDLLWVSAGTMFHFWCPAPVQVRTNEQTYRETYRTGRLVELLEIRMGDEFGVGFQLPTLIPISNTENCQLQDAAQRCR